MRERPILMSAPTVRAILAGTKTQTQTRRVVKPQPPADTHLWHDGNSRGLAPFVFAGRGIDPVEARCPYGVPGDRLWVRETWQAFFEDEVPVDRPRGPRHTMGIPARPDRKSYVYYKADGEILDALWKPSIHMPRWASRITLEITDVRVERLQEITDADCLAEGLRSDGSFGAQCSIELPNYMTRHDTPKGCYRALWESINGVGSWDLNPWVWVISFRRIGDA